MPSNKLPTELWDYIISYCDHPSECALSKVCHRLADIVNDRNELAIDKCRRKGITLPSEDIIALSFNNPGLPLDATRLTRHNPFGCPLSLRPSTVRGFEMDENDDGNLVFKTMWNEAGVMERGVLEFNLEFESSGIPRWIIDGLRPTMKVSAVLERGNGSSSGLRISASMGVWRLDGLSKDKKFMSKETILHAICTVDNECSESSFEVQIDPSSTIHGHPVVGGSDGIRIHLNTGNDVRISNVQISFQLPDKIPSQFSDWLEESRKLREHRSTTESKPCYMNNLNIGLFGL
ncbi:hypothetical protein PRIPAC_72091 [Pristionchus pacificus]|uniref:F-box domain-containing protein n=1 Tax=Pristionchus pacificus TaxID=54126 RepID=A0A454Y6M0_PRIPA|nr:hypothetical protein PRIPAC_72091 [Pristionchus pacificus]|eukprot:PDM80597.1 F-box domain-containing protein [Pristionchus pacificus]